MSDRVARVAFIADVNNFVNGVDKAQGKTKGFQDTMGKMAMPAALAFGAVTAAAVDFTKAAAEDQAAADILANTLRNTAGATAEQTAAVEDWITQTSMATAVADDELRPALGKLATATGDVGQAQDLMATALNVAAQTGKPLEAVTTALAKAHSGQLGALNKLIPGLVDTSDKSLTFADALSSLDEKTKGAAKQAANNDPWGKMGIALQETKEAIGAGLLPVLQALVPYLVQAATWVQQNSGLILTLGGVIAGVAGIILTMNVAMKAMNAISAIIRVATMAWTAAQWLLNVALTANPVGIVVMAIAALVAAIVVCYMKVDWFRAGVDAAFQFIKDIIGSVVTWITEKVPAAFTAIVDFVKGLPSKLGDIGSKIVEAITWPYKTAFNLIATLWNNTIGALSWTVPDWIPVIGGNTISAPKLPILGDGGIVTGPTLAIIGERGPEAVVPLDGRFGGGVNITINGALDPVGVARQIRTILDQANVRLGYA